MSRVLKSKKNLVTAAFGAAHKGIDIVGDGYSIDDIIAHSDGTVIDCKNTYTHQNEQTGVSYGNFVEIDHGQGYHTVYAHLVKGSVPVKIGQIVHKGQIIGTMGCTGRSNGIHLHFEVKKDGVKINPFPYIDADLPIVKPSDKTYTLVTSVPGYTNALNAVNHEKKVATYSAGEYYVYYEAMGMINITKTKGVAGAWINPKDNVKGKNIYINIPPTLVNGCRVYALKVKPVVGNEIGKLDPKKYGGLSYKVINENTGYANVVEIVTNTYGHVHIYVGSENGLSLTTSPLYTTEYDKS